MLAGCEPGFRRRSSEVVLKALSLEPAARYPDMACDRGGAPGSPAQPRARPAPPGAGRPGGVAALVAGTAVLARYRAPHTSVAPAAEMLAVLPFHTSGPGVEFLGEGMVDLLATNLRGVGGINTVAPRAVLREWGGEPVEDGTTSTSPRGGTRARRGVGGAGQRGVHRRRGAGDRRPLPSRASGWGGPRWTARPTVCCARWTGSVWRCCGMSGGRRSRCPICGWPR